jgi:hypothetical protein
MANLDLTGLKNPITKRFTPGTGAGGTITVDPLQVSEVHCRMESGGVSSFAVNGGDAVELDHSVWVRVWAGPTPGPATGGAQTVVIVGHSGSAVCDVLTVGRGR